MQKSPARADEARRARSRSAKPPRPGAKSGWSFGGSPPQREHVLDALRARAASSVSASSSRARADAGQVRHRGDAELALDARRRAPTVLRRVEPPAPQVTETKPGPSCFSSAMVR